MVLQNGCDGVIMTKFGYRNHTLRGENSCTAPLIHLHFPLFCVNYVNLGSNLRLIFILKASVKVKVKANTKNCGHAKVQ